MIAERIPEGIGELDKSEEAQTETPVYYSTEEERAALRLENPFYAKFGDDQLGLIAYQRANPTWKPGDSIRQSIGPELQLINAKQSKS